LLGGRWERFFVDKVLELLLLVTEDKTAPLNTVYVVSFCENGNALNQWRVYADAGRGYSIGFSTSKLLMLCSASNAGFFQLRRVCYGKSEQEALVRQSIRVAMHKPFMR
jgi:hypothetical protein